LVITMSEFVPGLNLHHWLGNEAFNWLQGALATPVVVWAGWPLLVRAWTSFRTWRRGHR
jgi:cation transport ATPase